MGDVQEAYRPPSEPIPSARASHRRLRSLKRPTRLAAILLLLVSVGPVTLVQTDSWQLLKVGAAEAGGLEDPPVIGPGKAMSLEPGTPLTLHMRDGSVLKGRYLGRTLLDSALYAKRFEEYARSSSYVPFALGETLRVSLRDDREWTAPFAGYAELTLLLRNLDGSQNLRIPFEFAREIHRANGDPVEPRALAKAFHARKLPSAEAIALEELLPVGSEEERWASALRVAVEDIKSVNAKTPGGVPVAGIVILSVVATVAVIALIAHNTKPEPTGCDSGLPPGTFARAHLTTRPFDRSRGCYVGDPLAVADPWPGSTESGPATALADPAMAHVLVR
jgi:hypothetical protein